MSQLLLYPSEYCAAASTPTFVYQSSNHDSRRPREKFQNTKSTQHHSDVKPNVHESFCMQTESHFLPSLIKKGMKGGGQRVCMCLHTLLERRSTTGLPPQINDLPVLSLKPFQCHNTSLIPSHTRVHFLYITEQVKVCLCIHTHN